MCDACIEEKIEKIHKYSAVSLFSKVTGTF